MEGYIAEIRMFGGNFAPRNWAFCNGQLLSIAQNTALFSLIGTTYGGNGTTTFALPDMQGRMPMHWGDGPGLTARVLGETAGAEDVTLISSEMPMHNHLANANSAPGDLQSPQGAVWAGEAVGATFTYSATANTTMNPTAIGLAGGNQPHENMPPFLCVSFIICQFGIFPSRN